MTNLKSALRIEKSINNSGKIFNKKLITKLKEQDYYIVQTHLDGDAPKQFIKAYIYHKNSFVRKKNLKTWIPYIAKTGEKWYPHESIVEFMINRIGQIIGLNMNEKGYIQIINRLSSKENENKVLNTLNKELFPLFIKERSELIAYILTQRFKIIREV